MNILAIDTATEACSAALFTNNQFFEKFEIAPQQHTQKILPMIQALLDEANLSKKELNGIAFGAGPGSFTGIRIATAITQGMALALDLPVVPVSTLAALAQNAYEQFSAPNILAAIDARMHQIYYGIYQLDQTTGLVVPMRPDTLLDPDAIEIPENTSWLGAGTGFKAYQDILLKHHNIAWLKTTHSNLYPNAASILKLALPNFKNKETLPASQARPVYLREKVV